MVELINSSGSRGNGMAKREGEVRFKAEQSFACRGDPSCLENERYI